MEQLFNQFGQQLNEKLEIAERWNEKNRQYVMRIFEFSFVINVGLSHASYNHILSGAPCQ